MSELSQISLQHQQNSKKLKKFVVVETSESKLIELLSPYDRCEFIPIEVFDDILSITFPSYELVNSYSDYHKIIKVKLHDLFDAPIINWEYNRPPDDTRCEDIARYTYISKEPMDTMLYVSFSNKKKMYEVLDGIHRFTALKIIKEHNSKPRELDLLTSNTYEFGSNNDATWLYKSYILLNVRFNATEQCLISVFKNLNKSIPIPELFVRDFASEKRATIINIVDNWKDKYKSHFSSNRKPNKPNINREQFIELVDYLYDKYKVREQTKVKLDYLLQEANTKISMNIPSKLTIPTIDKCTTTGCWLFVYPIETLKDMI